jgi:hypothetical protein
LWTPSCGAPPASEIHWKQNTVRSIAEHYLYIRKPHFETLRFDVIGILADRPVYITSRTRSGSGIDKY